MENNKLSKSADKISLLLLMIFQIFKIVLQIVSLILIIVFNITSAGFSSGTRLNTCSIYINNKYNYFYDIIFIMVFAFNVVNTALCTLSLVLIIKEFYNQKKNNKKRQNEINNQKIKNNKSPVQLFRLNKIMMIYYIIIAVQGLIVSIGFGQYFNIFFQNKNCFDGKINIQYLVVCGIQCSVLIFIFFIWILIVRYFNNFNSYQKQFFYEEQKEFNQFMMIIKNTQNKKNKSDFQHQLQNFKKSKNRTIQKSLLQNQDAIFIQNENYYDYKGNNQDITMKPIYQGDQQDQDYSQRQFNQNHQYLVYQNQDAKNRMKQLERVKNGYNYQDVPNNTKKIRENDSIKYKKIRENYVNPLRNYGNPLKNQVDPFKNHQRQRFNQKIVNQKGQLLIAKKDKTNQLKNISMNSKVFSYSSNVEDELQENNIFTPILNGSNSPLKSKQITSLKLQKNSKQEKKGTKNLDDNDNSNQQEIYSKKKINNNNLKQKNSNFLKKMQNQIIQECPINKFINEDQEYQGQQQKISNFMKINKKKKKKLLFTQDDKEGAKLYFHKRKNDEQRANISTSFNLFIDQEESNQIKLMSQNLCQMRQRQGNLQQRNQIKAKLKQFQMNSSKVNNDKDDSNEVVNSDGGLIIKKTVKKDGQLIDFIRSKFID